jgi:hypothetical protein
MHANLANRMSFKKGWKRGFSRPEYWLAIDSMILCFSVGLPIASFSTGWIAAIVFGVLLILNAVLVLPWKFSTIPSAIDAKEQMVNDVSTTIDSIMTNLDIDWKNLPINKTNELVDRGETTAAKKEYRNTVGVTWDQADAAIKDWPMTVLKAKLAAIEQAIANRETSAVA